MTNFTPSIYQSNIYDFVRTGKGNAVVNAVAGSGKSSTLEGICRVLSEIDDEGIFHVLFCAFNKAIAEELRRRLPQDVEVKTIHALGMAALRKFLRNVVPNNWIDDKKYTQIVEDQLDAMHLARDTSFYEKRDSILEATHFSMLTLVDPHSMEFMDMCARYDIKYFPGLEYLVGNTLEKGKQMASRKISFSDMVWLPVVLGAPMPTYTHVLVDEAQDLSNCQRQLIAKCLGPHSRLIAVGDPHQCQPKGTKVLKASGTGPRGIEEVPIESIKPNDYVVSYSSRECAFIKTGKRVNQVASRFFSGDLIEILTPHGSTLYTPEHKCFASFNGLREKWCVYLMRKGNQYRIGSSKMDYGNIGSGPIARSRAEKADALWLLELFDTKSEARVHEQILQGKFGLPGTIFTEHQIWAEIGDNRSRGLACLLHFGRCEHHPIYSKESKYTSLKRPMVIAACNLMNGCLVLPFINKVHTKTTDWCSISVSTRRYTGEVFSLEVEGTGLYVADGVTTHNSIYGFAGASSDSFGLIKTEFNAQEFPLSVCYRCPSSHIELAQQIVPQIEAKSGANEGVIEWIDEEHVIHKVNPQSGDMVICRTNAPLVELAFAFIGAGIPASIKGRDIMGQLVTMARSVQKLAGATWDTFEDSLQEYVERQREALSKKKDTEMQIAALEDRATCLSIIYRRAVALDQRITSIGGLRSFIDRIYAEEPNGCVVLSSIHKAKGLEADNVFFVAPENVPHPMAKSDWAYQQEWNLRYVALTRAKKSLTFVPLKKKKDKDES